jgi:hypothetical protein
MNTRIKLFTSLIVAGLMIAALFGALVFTGARGR